MSAATRILPYCLDHLPAGTRLGLAVSGGADSVALLHLSASLAREKGWTLRVLHLHHGLRAGAADADAAFVAQQAEALALPSTIEQADAAALGQQRQIGLEEAGRLLRYGWFRRLLLAGELDAVATGHTFNDQAETVVAKLLRGSWTAGLAGIYPVVPAAELPGLEVLPPGPPHGVLLRPLLGARRAELRAWLAAAGHPWREDETNQELRFTRNRIRHELLPVLSAFNPQVAERLVQLSTLARDEERYWQAEVARRLPGLLLPGRPVRGGGRASSTLPGERSLAFEVERLRALPVAMVRRLLRATAEELGATLGFAETERALGLLAGQVGSIARREQLTATLRAERSPRELRFVQRGAPTPASQPEISVPIPGVAEGFGVRLRVELAGVATGVVPSATLRAAAPADRVRLRYSSGSPKRVKEVLERMGVAPVDRPGWPVLAWQGELVWLRGAVLEPTPLAGQLVITVEALGGEATAPEPPPATP